MTEATNNPDISPIAGAKSGKPNKDGLIGGQVVDPKKHAEMIAEQRRKKTAKIKAQGAK